MNVRQANNSLGVRLPRDQCGALVIVLLSPSIGQALGLGQANPSSSIRLISSSCRLLSGAASYHQPIHRITYAGTGLGCLANMASNVLAVLRAESYFGIIADIFVAVL